MKARLIDHSLKRVALCKRPLVMLRGRLGDHVWYVARGKQRVRAVGNMDGNRWRNDPAFAGSRVASGVFGAAAALSGVFRNGLGAGCHYLGGRGLHTAITAAIQKTVGAKGGLTGPARLAVRDWVPAVLGLPFFRPVLPYLRYEVCGTRYEVEGTGTGNRKSAKGTGTGNSGSAGSPTNSAKEAETVCGGGCAAFYRFSVLGVWLSDGVIGRKGFRALRPELHGKVVRLVSEVVAADAMDSFRWEVDLMELADGAIPSGMGFAYCLGVEALDSPDAGLDWAGNLDAMLAKAQVDAGIDYLPVDSQTRRKFRERFRREMGDSFVGIVAGGVLVGAEERQELLVEGLRFFVGVGEDGLICGVNRWEMAGLVVGRMDSG